MRPATSYMAQDQLERKLNKIEVKKYNILSFSYNIKNVDDNKAIM